MRIQYFGNIEVVSLRELTVLRGMRTTASIWMTE